MNRITLETQLFQLAPVCASHVDTRGKNWASVNMNQEPRETLYFSYPSLSEQNPCFSYIRGVVSRSQNATC